MIEILFITRQQAKFDQVQEVLGDSAKLIMHHIPDLVEIQSRDWDEIATAKLDEAIAAAGEDKVIMIEDAGLCISALGGLPGTFTAYFTDEKKVGTDGMRQMARGLQPDGELRASVVSNIGLYIDGEKHFFRGEATGHLVPDTISPGGGWAFDNILIIDGTDGKVLGDRPLAERIKINHRGASARKLRMFLEGRS